MKRSCSCLITILALCLMSVTTGCTAFRVKQDIWRVERAVEIRGEVTGADKGKPVIVVLVRDDGRKKVIRNYSVRYGSGSFRFLLTPGSAYLFAFEDRNGDLHYQKGERAAWFGGTTPQKIALKDGEISEGLVIKLSMDVPEGTDEVVRPEKTEEEATLGRVKVSRGQVVSLDDPRFTEDKGKEGLWQPVHSAIMNGYGLYFLGPYDPARVPVVFVHGVGGYAQEFRTIIEHLDKTKFQPWVFQYPSGLGLDVLGNELVQAISELYAKYRFDRLVIVAHSMGGLVSRAAVNQIVNQYPNHPIKLFVSISTPWDGVDTARLGVDYSPVVVPAWRDVVPESPFLQRLFERPLPPSVPYYLMFGVVGGDGTDGSVPLTSVISLHAQDDAIRIYGYPETHTSILRSSAMIERLNTLLRQKAL
jgi:pimeloyl-ACP methyl ester carboxylesterase